MIVTRLIERLHNTDVRTNMKAIITNYLPYTATRPSRIKATSPDTRVSVVLSTSNIPDGNQEAMHRHVAQAFVAKVGWDKGAKLACGWLGAGKYAFCFAHNI